MDPSGIIGIIGVVAHILSTCTQLGMSWHDAPEDAKKFHSELASLHKALSDIQGRIIQDPDFIAAFEGKHSSLRRQDGTGLWLLESPEFQAWVQGDCQTLFCPGMPGAGKTMLSSIVIEYLQRSFGGKSSVGVSFVFCNFRRHDEQTPRNLLSSLLKQLYWTLPAGCSDVEKAYKNGSSSPSRREIEECLQSVASQFTKVYILVDALDEFGKDCEALLLSILGLQKTVNVNIFATSRHIPETESYFDTATSIEIRATDEDVMTFLDGHMSKLPSAVKKSEELQDEIKTSIVRTVQGMFLLAQLHLDSLQDKRSAKAIKDALRKLPTGSSAYDNAYNEAMERIEGQLDDQKTLAKDALSWIVYATRPLQTLELQHALAVEIDTAELDEDNITELEDIVSVCAGLITIDEESEVIRLVHYTTQEFFERTSERWLPNAQELIVDSCVTYLSFDAFSRDTSDSDSELEGASKYDLRVWGNPLFEYAAFEWGKHAQNISPPSERLLSFLMGRKRNLDAAADVVWSFDSDYMYAEDLTEVSGLHLAAFFGLREAFTIVLERSGPKADINVEDSRELTPLSYAVMGGRVDFIEWLLSKDEIEVDSEYFKDGYPPIAIAAMIGEVVRILPFIESDKANLDAENQEQETPLMHAVKRGHADIVKALVESDRINIELQNWEGETALMLAAAKGHVEMVRYLLERANANPNAVDDWGNTPLHHVLMADSSYAGRKRRGNPQYQAEKQVPITRCLLDSGQADASLSAESKHRIFSQDRDEGTPFEMALKYFGRDHSITRLLIDRMEVIGISTEATIEAWEDVQRFPYVSIDDYVMMWLEKYS
ncbi:Vegetative incompatibility protein HET-E-1 [Colletotrichum tropicale]|nr:Vegetative incompatibility protein HET-E-1 [Colletotrichum tropicale]